MTGKVSTEQGTISIQKENIFPIIKKWLYSEKEIFLRELAEVDKDERGMEVILTLDDGELEFLENSTAAKATTVYYTNDEGAQSTYLKLFKAQKLDDPVPGS